MITKFNSFRKINENTEYKPEVGDSFNDLFYGGWWIVTEITNKGIQLRNQETGDYKSFYLVDFLLMSGDKQREWDGDGEDDFRFLRVGKNQKVDDESIEKTRKDRLEARFKKDPEHAYHMTGTYYPVRDKHY